MSDTESSESSSASSAEDAGRPYVEGSVWSIQFTRTLPGLSKEYLRTLGSEWKPLMEEATRRGLIRGYRVLICPLSHRDDWDVMLVVEVDNMAALDGYNDRMEGLVKELRGGAGCSTLQETHGRPPDLVGMKLVREITLT
jgi:hypothetical protein